MHLLRLPLRHPVAVCAVIFAATVLGSAPPLRAAGDVTAVYFDSVLGEPLLDGRTHVIHEVDTDEDTAADERDENYAESKDAGRRDGAQPARGGGRQGEESG